MKIALTGATGFLGKRVVARLLGRGHQIHALGRKRPSDSRVAHFWWDAIEAEPVDASLEGVDAVIHLAGEPVAQRWTAETKRRIQRSRTTGTRHLVSAIGKLKEPPRVLVSSSATGYYGDRGDEELTERSPPGRGFLPDVCVEWEREAIRARDFGVRVSTIRTGIVLGPDGGALDQMLPPFRAGFGGKLGTGQQWMSWIHVDDLTGLLIHALEHGDGPLNGVAPQPIRNVDFTMVLASVLHRPAILPAPKIALKLLFGEMADVVVTSQRVFPEAAFRSGFSYHHTDLRKALQQILET